MNRWNINILDGPMREDTRKKILADFSLRKRLQAELDRLLPLEFDGTADPNPWDCGVRDVGDPYDPYVIID